MKKFLPEAVQNLNACQLKSISLICMLADHIACSVLWNSLSVLLPLQEPESFRLLLRSIGRSAFPIYCFLLVEGYFHTHSLKSYLLRMTVFALLSEIPFNLCMNGSLRYPEHQNVCFSFALGLLAIILCEKLKKYALSSLDWYVLCVGIGFFFGMLAVIFRLDYQLPGILLVVIFYLFYNHRFLQCMSGFLIFIWEPVSFPGFLLLLSYNHQRGRQHKYLFYFLYPAHLAAIYLCFMVLQR